MFKKLLNSTKKHAFFKDKLLSKAILIKRINTLIMQTNVLLS